MTFSSDVAKQVGLVSAEMVVAVMNFGELFEAVPIIAGYNIESDDMRQAGI